MAIAQWTTLVALAAFAAKSTLVLAIGWCGALVLRREPAGARHLIWLSVIVGLLLIPALAPVATLRVAVLPSKIARGAEQLSVASNPTAAPSTPAAAVTPNQTSDPARLDVSHSSASPSAVALAVYSWLVMATLLLAWLAMGRHRVHNIVRRATAPLSPTWSWAMRDAARELGLATVPRLVMSDEVEMPFACDVLSPTIVLPVSAGEWPAERRRAVLLHELAHVRRRDLVGHSIASVACAVYWFHPLVWIASRRLRAESELACDDLVLDRGVRPSEYAQHLLDMVTGLGTRRVAPAGALTLVRQKQFEGRLIAILDRASRPRVARRAQVASLLGVLGLMTISIAAAVPVPRTTPAMPSPAPVETMPSAPTSPTVGVVAPVAHAALSPSTIESFRRYGTAGIANPMLSILRSTDSLHLTAAQADSIATLNRLFTARLNAIWSPVGKYYASHAAADRDAVTDRLARAPQETIDLLIELAPAISGVLSDEQRRRLPDLLARYTDVRSLMAIEAGRGTLLVGDGVFVPLAPVGGEPRGRGRSSGGGM